MIYPDGALSSISMFIEHVKEKGPVWQGSKKFGYVDIVDVTPSCGVTDTGMVYYQYKVNTEGRLFKASCQDMHLIHQEYNDWYLFRTEAQARAFVYQDKIKNLIDGLNLIVQDFPYNSLKSKLVKEVVELLKKNESILLHK